MPSVLQIDTETGVDDVPVTPPSAAFDTVTLTLEVAERPAALYATAENVWEALVVSVVLYEAVYGAAVSVVISDESI